MSQLVCANPACGATFTPQFPRQTYHDRRCQASAQRVRDRARAREETRPDKPASTALPPEASGAEAAICDIERELLELTHGARLPQLRAALDSAERAMRAGDRVALRGELVLLGAKVAHWAAHLPRPVAQHRGERRRNEAA